MIMTNDLDANACLIPKGVTRFIFQHQEFGLDERPHNDQLQLTWLPRHADGVPSNYDQGYRPRVHEDGDHTDVLLI
jgi:hypothetical protein